MQWYRWTTVAAVILAFAALAAWQWDEYCRECALARETVSSSADSVMNALVGGILEPVDRGSHLAKAPAQLELPLALHRHPGQRHDRGGQDGQDRADDDQLDKRVPGRCPPRPATAHPPAIPLPGHLGHT